VGPRHDDDDRAARRLQGEAPYSDEGRRVIERQRRRGPRLCRDQDALLYRVDGEGVGLGSYEDRALDGAALPVEGVKTTPPAAEIGPFRQDEDATPLLGESQGQRWTGHADLPRHLSATGINDDDMPRGEAMHAHEGTPRGLVEHQCGRQTRERERTV